MQLNLYEIFSFGGWDLNDDCTYGNPDWLEGLWTNERQQRYLIKSRRQAGRTCLDPLRNIFQRR